MDLAKAERTWILSSSQPIAREISVRFNQGRRNKVTIFTRQAKDTYPLSDIRQIEIEEGCFEQFRSACLKYIHYLVDKPPIHGCEHYTYGGKFVEALLQL